MKNPEEEMISGQLMAAFPKLSSPSGKMQIDFSAGQRKWIKVQRNCRYPGLSEKTVENQISIALKKIRNSCKKDNYLLKEETKGYQDFFLPFSSFFSKIVLGVT
jgi:hypothetical protein